MYPSQQYDVSPASERLEYGDVGPEPFTTSGGDHALPSTIATGVNIFKDMMITWGDLDALICTSDEMACGCMMACHSAGIKVPNTVAIASLGGGVLSTVCSPALTTVEFPWHDIGVKAGKALLELLNDKPCEKFIEIPSELKVRASTAV